MEHASLWPHGPKAVYTSGSAHTKQTSSIAGANYKLHRASEAPAKCNVSNYKSSVVGDLAPPVCILVYYNNNESTGTASLIRILGHHDHALCSGMPLLLVEASRSSILPAHRAARPSHSKSVPARWVRTGESTFTHFHHRFYPLFINQLCLDEHVPIVVLLQDRLEGSAAPPLARSRSFLKSL